MPSADRFRFSARIAIEENAARHHLLLDWQHLAEEDEILLSTPLGQGLARLTAHGDLLRLTLADGRVFAADAANEALRELVSADLPLSAVRLALFDESLTELSGWRIASRQSEAGLPRRLVLERGDLRLTLVIDQWETP